MEITKGMSTELCDNFRNQPLGSSVIIIASKTPKIKLIIIKAILYPNVLRIIIGRVLFFRRNPKLIKPFQGLPKMPDFDFIDFFRSGLPLQ